MPPKRRYKDYFDADIGDPEFPYSTARRWRSNLEAQVSDTPGEGECTSNSGSESGCLDVTADEVDNLHHHDPSMTRPTSAQGRRSPHDPEVPIGAQNDSPGILAELHQLDNPSYTSSPLPHGATESAESSSVGQGQFSHSSFDGCSEDLSGNSPSVNSSLDFFMGEVDDNEGAQDIDFDQNQNTPQSEDEHSACDQDQELNQDLLSEDEVPQEENVEVNHVFDDSNKFSFLRQKLQGEFSAPITETAQVNRADILLNSLNLFKQHNLSNAAQEDILRLVNSVFNAEIMPCTRFELDKLLNDKNHLKYHFYCKGCTKIFEGVDNSVQKFIDCPCGVHNKINNLWKAQFFITLDVQYQLQLLLDKNSEVSQELKSPKDALCRSTVLKDLYDGEMYHKFATSLDYESGFKFLSFTLCTDGSPLFKSSKCSIWPAFLLINELPPLKRSENLILIGLWFGNAKPKMDLFLKPIIDEIRSLSLNAFHLNVGPSLEKFKCYLIACCIDSGARGLVQGVHQHNGTMGCNWCMHPGLRLDRARKYPVLDEIPCERTAEQVLRDGEIVLKLPLNSQVKHVNGVKGISPLIAAPSFDIVKGMIVEYMHAGPEGIFKYFTLVFLEDPEESCYIGDPTNVARLETRLSDLSPPKEVRKMPRKIADIHHWSGREWENWLLFFSVPVLTGILKDQFLNHWILLVQAFHILLMTEISSENLNLAQDLLTQFAGNVPHLYSKGIKHMTFNLHLVCMHIVSNVKRWGPLWSISAFAFEAGNGRVKRMIHANRGIPHQVCRTISQENACAFLKKEVGNASNSAFSCALARKEYTRVTTVGEAKLVGKHRAFSPVDEEKYLLEQQDIQLSNCVLYDKMLCNGFTYSVSSCNRKSDNSVALLENGSIVKIHKIFVDESSVQSFIIASKIRTAKYRCPRCCAHLSGVHLFLERVTSIDHELLLFSVQSLKSVYVSMQLPHGHFISSLPNIYNTC